MIQGLFANVDLGLFYVLLSGMGLIWVVYGIFRLSGFQIMFGLMGLIVGILAVGVLLLVVFTNLTSGDYPSDQSFNWKHLPLAIGALTVSYFLLFDKQVAQYRRQLALHFPDKDSLDPKVDNLPDDPINPS